MESHLLQMRGLKHRDAAVFKLQQDVASFTDAWIETRKDEILSNPSLVASFTDAWIETGIFGSIGAGRRRIFYRCVDWNISSENTEEFVPRRIFYRCVDWNYLERVFC